MARIVVPQPLPTPEIETNPKSPTRTPRLKILQSPKLHPPQETRKKQKLIVDNIFPANKDALNYSPTRKKAKNITNTIGKPDKPSSSSQHGKCVPPQARKPFPPTLFPVNKPSEYLNNTSTYKTSMNTTNQANKSANKSTTSKRNLVPPKSKLVPPLPTQGNKNQPMSYRSHENENSKDCGPHENEKGRKIEEKIGNGKQKQNEKNKEKTECGEKENSKENQKRKKKTWKEIGEINGRLTLIEVWDWGIEKSTRKNENRENRENRVEQENFKKKKIEIGESKSKNRIDPGKKLNATELENMSVKVKEGNKSDKTKHLDSISAGKNTSISKKKEEFKKKVLQSPGLKAIKQKVGKNIEYFENLNRKTTKSTQSEVHKFWKD